MFGNVSMKINKYRCDRGSLTGNTDSVYFNTCTTLQTHLKVSAGQHCQTGAL